MTKRIGLWIDHKRAVILTMSERGEAMQTIESGIDRHISYRGATRPRTPYSPQYQKGDDQLDKQFNGLLKKYYSEIMSHLRGADAILIFGPRRGEGGVEETPRPPEGVRSNRGHRIRRPDD
ncbi:MAG: hypothetical protein HND47_23455 [Chloroflexi bacterium]|nr:hypothetical protein [Chloroflexota bacterium]